MLGGGVIILIISLVAEDSSNFLQEVIISLAAFSSLVIIFEIINLFLGDKLNLWWLAHHNRLGKPYRERNVVIWLMLRSVAFYLVAIAIFALALSSADLEKILPDMTIFFGFFTLLIIVGDIFHRRFVQKRTKQIAKELRLTIPSIERYQELLQQPQFELFLYLGEPPALKAAANFSGLKIVTSTYGYKNIFVCNAERELLFVVGDLWTRTKRTQRYSCIDPFGNKFGKILQVNNLERIYEVLIVSEAKRILINFGLLTERFQNENFGDIIKKMKCSVTEIQKGGTLDFDCRVLSKDTKTLGAKIGELYTIGDYDIRMESFQVKTTNLVMVLAACMIIEKLKVLSF